MSTPRPPPRPIVTVPSEPLRVWRDGARLVTRRGFTIDAPRCVLCSGRATGTARFAARGTVMQVPLCSPHVSGRRRARLIGSGVGLLGLALLGIGLSLDFAALALLGLYAAIGAVVYATWALHLLTLDHADPHFLRLRGADLRYLDGLRAWGDYPEPAA